MYQISTSSALVEGIHSGSVPSSTLLDEIAPTLKKAFDTPGPVLVEVHVDYRDNAKLFEHVHEGTIV